MPVVSEILDTRDIELFLEKADIIQIGARNMQNFELLKEVGAYDKPVLLKRGLSATIKEFLLSRITSYNVCYTKLLRVAATAAG